MTTNNFGELAEERDRDLSRNLYHQYSLMRDSFREWIVAEVKELDLEANRLCSLVGAVQRGALERVKNDLKEIEPTNRSRFSREETAASEAARNDVFDHVHEPASRMLSDVMALVEIIEGLKKCRVEIEAVSRTDNG